MDTNHFFSFSRIAMVMKREIIENWKKNLYAFIGLYAAFALVVVGNMWGMSMNAENAFASPDIFFVRYCTNILGAFIFICLLGSLIYASGILDNMRNKEMRISFLMLPATMLEKYVARFLMATLGFIIAAIVGMLLAEVTRYILLPLFDLPDVFHSSALFKVFSMLTIDGEQAFRGSYAFNMEYMPWLGEACGWSFLIWSHSLYVLGGSFWYKRAFLKTLGTLIVISILGSIITVQIVEWIGEEGMKASFDVTLSPKDLYRFNMYQTYTGFQGWSSIALGILGFVMAGISFQNGKTSYTLLYAAVGFLFLLYIPVTLWFRAKETLKTNKVLAGTLHYEITEKNIHVSQGKETGDMEWQAIYKIVANAKQILIYSNRKSAYIIPMEQMGDQYAAFRTLAEQKLEKYKLRMKA